MKAFQVDENLNCRRFLHECREAGVCHVLRYPKSLKGKIDAEMLPVVLSRETPLVTTDYRIVEENRNSIIYPNCGMIVFRPSSKHGTLTIKIARRLISKFKSSYPSWHSQDWSNVELNVYDHYIYVARLCNDPTIAGKYFSFGDVTFIPDLAAYISEINGENSRFLTVDSSPARLG